VRKEFIIRTIIPLKIELGKSNRAYVRAWEVTDYEGYEGAKGGWKKMLIKDLSIVGEICDKPLDDSHYWTENLELQQAITESPMKYM
jgi:hypothetical protein